MSDCRSTTAQDYIDGFTCANDVTARDMIHSVAHAAAMASEVSTVLPGDVVLTGTPSGVTRPGANVNFLCGMLGA